MGGWVLTSSYENPSSDIAQRGLSRICRWTMPDGSQHEQRYKNRNPRINGVALWKVHVLGAVYAECLDLFGNVTQRVTR